MLWFRKEPTLAVRLEMATKCRDRPYVPGDIRFILVKLPQVRIRLRKLTKGRSDRPVVRVGVLILKPALGS
jgi:hypothetical protein